MNKKELVVNNRGFTLIEVMVSVIIIGVLMTVGFSTYGAVQKRSRDVKRQSDLAQIKSALQQYYADKHYYPSSINFSSVSSIDDCTGEGCASPNRVYLQSVPKDPDASKSYCYKAQLNEGDTSSTCTNAAGSKCLYYALCAKLENPKSPKADACSCGANYFVTPKSVDSSQ